MLMPQLWRRAAYSPLRNAGGYDHAARADYEARAGPLRDAEPTAGAPGHVTPVTNAAHRLDTNVYERLPVIKKLRTIWIPALFALLCAPSGARAATGPDQQAGPDGLSISSLMFLSLTRQQQVTGGRSTHDLTGPTLSRGYITARKRFNPRLRMRLTTNVEADPNLPGQKAHAWIKYAFLVGKISPAVHLVAGLMHTPWIHYEQDLDRHRFISKCFINSNGLDHSSDAGLGLKGELLHGRFGYWMTETAGGGYTDLKRTRGGDFDGRIGFYPQGPSPANGWTFDVQYRKGFPGKDVAAIAYPSRYQLTQAMTTYTHDDTFRIAAGYVIQHQSHYKEMAVGGMNTHAYYLWAWDRFTDRIDGYCRYEFRQQHDAASAAAERKKRSVLALDYRASRHLSLALAWDHTAYANLGMAANIGQQNNIYGLYSRISF